jgi:hypothetical protein
MRVKATVRLLGLWSAPDSGGSVKTHLPRDIVYGVIDVLGWERSAWPIAPILLSSTCGLAYRKGFFSAPRVCPPLIE